MHFECELNHFNWGGSRNQAVNLGKPERYMAFTGDLVEVRSCPMMGNLIENSKKVAPHHAASVIAVSFWEKTQVAFGLSGIIGTTTKGHR